MSIQERRVTGYCPRCWVLVAGEPVMVALAVRRSGALWVAKAHNRPATHTAPRCIGTGLPLERAA
jgi:hypothetical protein